MLIWRMCVRQHAKRAFRGEGAQLWGGRWNPPGLPVVYCSESLSLACLEMLVHADPEDLPSDLVAIPAEIPASVKTQRLEMETLPTNWREYPAPRALSAIGENWFKAREYAVLSAPSAVIPVERNYLLNPLHPDFHSIVVQRPAPFIFDHRLWRARKRLV